MTTTTLPDVCARISARVHETAERLRLDPFYGRLIRGQVTRHEYALWLVQKHKYVRYTEGLIRHLETVSAAAAVSPTALSLHEYARQEALEEANHDELLVKDLAKVWNVSRGEARGRIEVTPRAPSILTYARIYEAFLVHQPKAQLGIAFALETLASMHADEIRKSLVAESGIEGIESAVQFLAAHCAEVEGDHSANAAAQIRALTDPTELAAVEHLAGLALHMYEGIHFYLALTI